MLNATQPQSAYSQLTEKQRAFVDALCLEPNISATQAAIQAGYAKSGARVEGHRLLTNANIRKALGERLKDTSPTPEEIARRWDRVSRATLDDFYTRKKVEVRAKVKQPLTEAIERIKEEIEYEYEFMVRSWDVLKTSEDDRAAELVRHEQYKRSRRLDILRHQMQLERNPNAFRIIDGPPKTEEVLELDLVKAQKAGVLDLAKAIKPTAHGIGVELRDPDGALDKLARMAGAYEKDNAQQAPLVMPEIRVYTGAPPLSNSEKDVDDDV
ncbi:terminase small subunit [Hymenobacter sp. B81]|uniref:terminase small subunit n=1 Tax=Hymenobacter sp. B81 TaxID=3344878 RepID=UPI0037DD568D